jgi:hypothetical protein
MVFGDRGPELLALLSQDSAHGDLGHICEMPRCRAVLSGVHKLADGDLTAWLRWSDSNSEMSSQTIPLKGRTDFRGSSRIPATETIRV